MSDTTPTPDPDSAIYPDGTTGESGTCNGDNCHVHGDDVPRGAPEMPSTTPAAPAVPGQVTSQVNGEMLIANLLVEIANLTRRALAAETMVQMYQQAAQPKPAQ